jgi:ubiquitin-protein ligase
MALSRSIKRIMNDVTEIRKDPIDGVSFYQCEENVKCIYVVIAGPKDSAYEDGLYFFQFHFPDDYPHNPPKVKFLNWQNNTTRMHPNMYVDGKLCMSHLGTWEGPSWTSVMSLSTIILDIQSIMDDNPLKNEPGYEKNSDSIEHNKYKRVIQYYNYRDFVGKSIECVFNSNDIIKEHNSYIEYFKDFIKDYYIKKGNHIIQQLDKLKVLYPAKTSVSTAYQSTNAVINYSDLYVEMIKKLKLLTDSF